MTDILVIRLPEKADQSVHWIHYSVNEDLIKDYGKLNQVSELTELSALSLRSDIQVLLPGQQVSIQSCLLPKRAEKKIDQALPALLEDSVADNIERLHFVALEVVKERVTVAVIAHSYIQTCLDWLAHAGLQATRMIPDWLALPYQEGETTAVKLGNDWLFREGTYQGFTLEQECLPILYLVKAEQDQTRDSTLNQNVRSFSSPPEDSSFFWQAGTVIPALTVLARGCLSPNITLLSGPYRQNKTIRMSLLKWAAAACMAILCFVILSVIEKGLIFHRLTQEIKKTQIKAEQAYQALFLKPQKVVNLKAQFNALTNEMKSQPKVPHLMDFLAQIAIGIANMRIQPRDMHWFALRYDREHHSLYLQIGVNHFSEFEQLRNGLSEKFIVEQGVLVQEKKRVNGTFTLKNKTVEANHLKVTK